MESDKTTKTPKLNYKELGFEHKKITDKFGKIKNFAVCIRCSTELTNTSISRLEQHRDCCDGVKKMKPGIKYAESSIIYPDSECKLGRHLSKMYSQLGFKPGRILTDNGKYKCVALCLVCNKNIRNTSANRLSGHRKICNSEAYPVPDEPQKAELEDTFIEDNLNVIKEEDDLSTDKTIENTDSLDQEDSHKPSNIKTSPKCSSSFGRFCEQLGFRLSKIKFKSGLARNISVCLICRMNIPHTTKARLLAHRETCNSEKYKYPLAKDVKRTCPPGKVGRNYGQLYNLLGYRPVRVRNNSGILKNVALCLVCNKEIRNTSGLRLAIHRKVCKSAKYKYVYLPSLNNDLDSSEGINTDKSTQNIQILKSDKSAKTPRKVGRNCSELYDQLGFKSDKQINSSGISRNVATCLVCNTHLRNTSSARLVSHRRVCLSDKYTNLTTEEIFIETVNYNVEDNQIFDANEAGTNTEYSEMNNVILESTDTVAKASNEGGSGVKLEYIPRSKRRRELSPVFDLNSTDVASNMTAVQEAIANFIYGCNLPLSITKSVHFERLIRTLDVTCLKDIPKPHELSNVTLVRTYKRCLEEIKCSWQYSEASLVLDTVESKDGHRFFVSVLQDGITGQRAFVNCSALKNNIDDEENFNEMVMESVELAKYLYNTDVYSIVTDKIIKNENAGNFGNIWYLTCNRYLATLLLQDLLATVDFKTCLFKAKIVADGVKIIEFKEPLTYKKTNLGPEIDNLYFIVGNWNILEQAFFSSLEYNLSNDIKFVFCNYDFKNVCEMCIDKIDFLNGFIKKLNSRTCSLADSLVLWQNFVKDPMVRDTSDVFTLLVQERVKETKNVYSLVAHYFGEARNSDFSPEEHKKLADFFHRVLSRESFKEYRAFENKEVASVFERDDYYKSVDFWEMMKKDLPNFAEFALLMLRIPGSTGDLRVIFKDFSVNCGDVGKEQLRKLMSVYFSLRIKEIKT